MQTAFREHGARLQSIYDRRQRTDVEMARREQEMKQLQGALPAPAHSCYTNRTCLYLQAALLPGHMLLQCRRFG